MKNPPPVLAAAVSRELGDASILWSDTPSAMAYARNRFPQALIGIPFTAFAIFWTWGASGGFSNKGKTPPTFFILWGCMFICIGLSILLSPLFAMWKSGRVFYAVTDERVVIFEKIWSVKIHSFDATSFGGFERISRGEKQGDIVFQRNIERRGKNTKVSEVGFIGLQDFALAEEALRKMIKNRDAKHFITTS